MSTESLLQSDSWERQLEPVERQVYADFYAALPESVARDCGISWEQTDDQLRLTCRGADHPFFNRVMGARAPSQGVGRWLGEILDHYREQGVERWMLQVAPGDEAPVLAGAFSNLGLVRLRGWAKHAGAVQRIPLPPEDPRFDLRIESVGQERAMDWASIVVPAFSFPSGSEEWPAAIVGRPGWVHYVAYDGDRPVACAAMVVVGSIGTLGFTATLESHRRRGAQSALIGQRVRDARRLGLDWLVTETDEELPDRPNPSYRNIVRSGLAVRYVRSNWGPPPPGPPGSQHN